MLSLRREAGGDCQWQQFPESVIIRKGERKGFFLQAVGFYKLSFTSEL